MFHRRLGRIASMFVPCGVAIPVIRGPLRGMKWIAGSAAGGGKGLSVILNLVEPEQLDIAKKLVPADGVCFDIGANVGLYTLLFAARCRQTFAFEPLPRNIRYLSKTLHVNKVNNVTIVPCAVSDSKGLSLFHEGVNCAMGKLSNIGKQPVATISCDEFVDIVGLMPDLIKIDVEGAELSVLNGSKNLLSCRKPVILLSTHGESLRDDCLELLRKVGYTQISSLNGFRGGLGSEFAIMP